MFNLFSTAKLSFLFLIISGSVIAQEALTIEQCQLLARNNYPLIKQIDLLETSKKYSINKATKSNLPQLVVAGQATHQSDVTAIPIKLPGITIDAPSKNQYKIYGELYQPLTDFGVVKQQKTLIEANAAVETQKIENELFKLRERVNQLFFSILMMDAQITQSQLILKDIMANVTKVEVAIQNGTATKTNAALLNAEALKIEQRITELVENKKAYQAMLSDFINQPIAENTIFKQPDYDTKVVKNNRPELKLFMLQQAALMVQDRQINQRYIPKLGIFFQGGYGRPALNMLSNSFDTYYIGGLRMQWNLTSFYTTKNDRGILKINQQIIDNQKDAFLMNTNIAQKQYDAEIQKNKMLIQQDNKIIALRAQITKTASTQLENGVISPLDFIAYINAEDQAKQTLVLHQIQLLMAQANLNYTLGN